MTKVAKADVNGSSMDKFPRPFIDKWKEASNAPILVPQEHRLKPARNAVNAISSESRALRRLCVYPEWLHTHVNETAEEAVSASPKGSRQAELGRECPKCGGRLVYKSAVLAAIHRLRQLSEM